MVMDITKYFTSRREQALLLGDYNTYRAQNSRRLHTLRAKLGRTSTKGRKYVGRAAIGAEDIAKDVEYAHLMILATERAWAHAMHMKSVHSEDPTTQAVTGPTRRHIISRLNKATGFAQELCEVLGDGSVAGASELDLVEARAYYLSLHGSMYFERKRWEDCLTAYAAARICYAALQKATSADVFKDVLANSIDPSLRYAAYQCRIPRTVAIPVIAQRGFPRSQTALVALVEKLDVNALGRAASDTANEADESDAGPKTITWRRRTVAIEDAAIAVALARVRHSAEALTDFLSSPTAHELEPSERAIAYDDVLSSSQDAIDATRHALDELAADGVASSDARMQALQITRTAVTYESLSWRIGRNRVLTGEHDGMHNPSRARKRKRSGDDSTPDRLGEEGVSKRLANLSERVVLYGASLQSIDAILDLAGVAADEGLLAELEIQRGYFEGLRGLAIARAHALLSRRRAALAILAHVSERLGRSLDSHPSAQASVEQGPARLQVGSSDLHNLLDLIRGECLRYHALVEMDSLDSSEKAVAVAPLLEDLATFPLGGATLTRLVSYPPRPEPVPVKPLFLDVAWNYIEDARRNKDTSVNGQPATVAAASGAQAKDGGKKGWFGFGR